MKQYVSRFEGNCQNHCGHAIRPGQTIERVGRANAWQHVTCPPKTPICAICNLQMPCECDA